MSHAHLEAQAERELLERRERERLAELEACSCGRRAIPDRVYLGRVMCRRCGRLDP